MKKMRSIFLTLLAGLLTILVYGQTDISYKQPPQAIADVVLAAPTPGISIDNEGIWMLISERSDFPGISELAEPELRIAGLRINPENFGPSRGGYVTGFELKNIKTGEKFSISGLPGNLRAGNIQWSPDQKHIAFTHTTTDKITLWNIRIADKNATQVTPDAISDVLGTTYTWAGNDAIIYKAVIKDLTQKPPKPKAPSGPIVQENLGKEAASRTYQDLIKNPYDEDLFEFYATTQLKRTDGKILGKPAIYNSINLSPDDEYLLVDKLKKPFSYLVPAGGFAKTIEILDAQNGMLVKEIAQNPSTETAPIGLDNVVDYARNFNWRNDKPATLYYVKALDKGLGKNQATYRDAVYTWDAPFTGEPKELVKTTMRYRGISWGNENTALLYEGFSRSRQLRMNKLNPATGQLDSLYQRRQDDQYADIGQPVTRRNEYAQNVLHILPGDKLLMRSQGASDKGDMPLLQTFDLKTGKVNKRWQSAAPYYEQVVNVIDPVKMIFITSREGVTETPNYYLHDLSKKSKKAITDFKDPQPALRLLSKEKIYYKRKDGVDLTGTLYLPAGYNKDKDGPLPVLIWAYPREFKSADDAGQVRGSQYTYTKINYGSPVYWALQGYAVLDNAEMPIVGEGENQPNDNFVDQLKMNAEAAINTLASKGVGDPNRVAVGGHSYGAFMTANLLAHTNLFKAGLARSGAYNRTLTPFGFQNEERTYWQAPELYFEMSPFSHADKIKTPLLLIHGEADNNSGTFPIQSERLYNAIKGHGGTVRYVVLPYESHGYAAKENILHMLWEQHQWLEKYVKNAGDDKKGF